uniref:Uncharacterized protein n=1 Tax=Utricularia reniformis TaxID=192314 RepID=A0A1Y0B0B6_9LAMI|nr:hypothetical protein AEK19_MT0602 [Utricularia reniformis]ART30857.1 hypothetical protein AEK19_MT0602 [Utricularia reniformis]
MHIAYLHSNRRTAISVARVRRTAQQNMNITHANYIHNPLTDPSTSIRKANNVSFALVANDEIGPAFIPSDVSIGQIRP